MLRALGMVVLSMAAALPAPAQGPLRRLAVVAGNDHGGEGTRPLLYAKDDARKIHDVLVRLGGLAPEDTSLLLDAGSQDLLTAIGEMERKARDARSRGERTALFVYYSGHAKDGALRLGDTKLPFESLKNRLAQAPADIRIAVFDACRSGTMTRTKGARRAPAFEVESDATRAARGLVILTSSAADEDSQESDQIGGSYFSHHLASGLLGDADRSGDGRVSLSEAYAYAYDRTVADTAESAAGAQHPTFSFDLAGNGDVVLTDVAQRREGVLFPASAPEGPYFLIDQKGFVAAEVVKAQGTERRIALAPGLYRVKRRLQNRLRVGEVFVREGQVATLNEAALRDAPFSDDPAKGPGRAALYAQHYSVGVAGTYQSVFDAPTTRGGHFPSAPLLGLEVLSHNFFGRGFGLGFDLLLGGSDGSLSTGAIEDVRYKYGQVSLGASIVAEWPEGAIVPFVGARLGANLMSREFPGTALPKQGYYTLTPGAIGGLRLRLSRKWSLAGRARLHYLLYNIDETKNFGYLELATLLSYEL
ncbi:MAG: caspase family protein [Myxococcales bacterium]|nr:caspase family protein [Myxococcales bacterium]